MRRRIMLAVALVSATAAAVVIARAAPPPVPLAHSDHVFIIVLENENSDSTFGPNTEIPYLANTLKSQGEYLPNYYAIGHLSLDNYIAMISGQPPSSQTQADCPGFTQFTPATPTDGIYVGQGCVFPPGVQNIATQLDGNGWTWKGYMQDMDTPATPAEDKCRHPALNAQDDTQTAEANDQYATRHNPFVYFRSLIETQVQASCLANDVDLSHLTTDLASANTTPNYSFIVPDLCNDGHDGDGTPGSCVDGGPGGMVQANQFLQTYVPQITGSPAFQNEHGLLIVTFDEAEFTDTTACCNEVSGPNTPNAGGPIPGPGGGKIGAVLVSPDITPGTVDQTPYNHYSLLGTLEDNFGLPRLGYARDVKPFAGLGGSGSPPAAQTPASAAPSSKCVKAKKKKKKKAKHHASTAKKHKKHKHKKKSCKKKKKKKHKKKHHGR